MSTLERFVSNVRSSWGPMSTELVAVCQQQLDDLVNADCSEQWLALLHLEAAVQKELYRDPEHGFILLAYTEPAGLYRQPHDHGRGWAIYAVQHGAVEVGTYARIEDQNGDVKLIKRGSTVIHAGESQVYLPGDIHDTRCLGSQALIFRLTDRDLKKEDKEARRMTRYVEQAGNWVPETRQ
ncbi:hypothetical protein RBE51_02555 [Pseudomonas taiwanensis]|uniref:hypothetical protein n=1 Tax=Pseudomonas taiwanensis TaxID=470150 RepID=UPI0028DEB912|nr:hypothetical protein [Pseudomonas taiwanensis]MDT8921723.1 hypothetical protein [Pseudomonas taiwanensis]